MSTMNKVAKELKTLITESDSKKPKAYDTEAVVVRTEDSTLWVKFPGGDMETPVQKTIDAKPGDVVMVRVSNHRAWTAGNSTNPPTDDTRARAAQNTASDAAVAAQRAWDQAASAEEAANVAWDWADDAHRAADEAWREANDAHVAAASAHSAADMAWTNAAQAAIDADNARQSAESAEADARSANESAQSAAQAAIDAQEDAAAANDNAEASARSADEARNSASDAASSALDAADRAGQAIESARTANVAASGAVSSLGIVQDVLGTLNWISEHAEYEPTEDTFVIPSKYYFIRSGTGTDADPYTWSPILPTEDANPQALGYYEIVSIQESVTNYVSTHLAVGDKGLYIQTDEGDRQSRILISPDEGVTIFGPTGEVAKYGASAIIGNEEDLHIEINKNEVGFYDGPSATEVNNPTGNPKTQNYYEKVDGVLIPTEDTSVVSEKTYYIKNVPVAYVNNQRLYITQSVVLDNMMVGENKWIWKYDDRDDSIILKWIGGEGGI